MTALSGIKEALVASLGDIYSRENSSLAVAEQEAIASVVESLLELPDAEMVSPIRAASRSGVMAAINALSTEADWAATRMRLSSGVDLGMPTWEEKPPADPPEIGSSYANTSYQHCWSSGRFEIVLSENVPPAERIVLENHISPWVCVSYGGELTENFELGTTELL